MFVITKGGGLLKIEPLTRGAAKISSLEFRYLHPPLPYYCTLYCKSLCDCFNNTKMLKTNFKGHMKYR